MCLWYDWKEVYDSMFSIRGTPIWDLGFLISDFNREKVLFYNFTLSPAQLIPGVRFSIQLYKLNKLYELNELKIHNRRF
jgi:hypothetical protein